MRNKAHILVKLHDLPERLSNASWYTNLIVNNVLLDNSIAAIITTKSNQEQLRSQTNLSL